MSKSLHEEGMDQARCEVTTDLLATPADLSKADKLPGWRPEVAFRARQHWMVDRSWPRRDWFGDHCRAMAVMICVALPESS